MLRKEKGFTLIELLIVVAIIGIIAAIAVPNLLTAIQRSKRSRTAADLRAIGTALGSYNVDNNQFPASANAAALFPLLQSQGHYSGSQKDGWNREYTYIPTIQNAITTGYTLISRGKDGGAGVTNSEFDSDVIYIDGGFRAPDVLSK